MMGFLYALFAMLLLALVVALLCGWVWLSIDVSVRWDLPTPVCVLIATAPFWVGLLVGLTIHFNEYLA